MERTTRVIVRSRRPKILRVDIHQGVTVMLAVTSFLSDLGALVSHRA
jgi:hypothetical protein